MQILIVEDEDALRESMVSYLELEGFRCEQAASYHVGLFSLDLHDYSCMLIDLNLPDGDGLDLVRFAKQNQEKSGIIIISARSALEERVKGLELGADDYLVKPFHLSELAARIQSVVRRTRTQGGEILEFGAIRLAPEEKQCFVKDKPVDLTGKECDLLLYLMANRNRVITKESIADYLWGDYGGGYGSYDFIYTHLKNLRRKLEDAGCPDYIRNIYGVGYKFSLEE
ncbi:MAG: response regulator transcription factor [Bacteroidetes bacterium]|nr:response regulator transcription factor [Bacteroidota bacterium]